MSDPVADSADATGEATGVGETPADSTPTPEATGQEQGDQSKRVNDLMSLANRRLSERDQALAEIESLRAQLDAQVLAEQTAFEGESQIELMHPEQYTDEDPDYDPMEPPEPPVINMPVNPMRPDHALQPGSVPDTSTPAGRYVRDQGEIAAMKAQLNKMGAQWWAGQKESGLVD
jgi:hypothetical protein